MAGRSSLPTVRPPPTYEHTVLTTDKGPEILNDPAPAFWSPVHALLAPRPSPPAR